MKQILAWIAAGMAAILAVFHYGKRTAGQERETVDAKQQQKATEQRVEVRDGVDQEPEEKVRDELRNDWVRRD